MSDKRNEPPPKLDYLSPQDAPPASGRWLPMIFALVFLGMFIVASVLILLPSTGPHATSPRVQSASNLRQIGQAILLYTNDLGGKYPDTFGDILLNEDLTSGVFVSPLSNDTPAVG